MRDRGTVLFNSALDRIHREGPRRVQRGRTKGWRMPPYTVYVGRPSKWGNPHVSSNPGMAVTAYRLDLELGILPITPDEVKQELQDRDLACWCTLDQPCHADVLLEVANEPS